MISYPMAVLSAVLAAVFYALNAPLSKWLLGAVPPTMMAALLYLGAGAGMAAVRLAQRRTGKTPHEAPLTRRDLPYTVAMVVLDIAAPIFLMIGLTRTTAANASLLNNFEIVATALIARLVFGEAISRRLWGAIVLVTVSSIVLTVEDSSSFSFSVGSVFVLLACTCWGLENNCTRSISDKDPLQIVVIKGFGSGAGSLVIALAQGERLPAPGPGGGGAAAGLCGLRAEHLLLHLRPAGPGRGQNQRVLCAGALPGGGAVAADFPGNSRPHLFSGPAAHGGGHLAGFYRTNRLNQKKTASRHPAGGRFGIGQACRRNTGRISHGAGAVTVCPPAKSSPVSMLCHVAPAGR